MKKSMANSLINGEHILKLIGWGAKGSQTLRHILSLLLVLMLTACAHWADRQEPEVHLTKVEPLPSAGLEQRFLIGLRIVNPNNAPLAVSGLSYSLSLQDSKVITGVSSKIGTIPAYSDTVVELESSVSLVGVRALMSILNETEAVKYELEARLSTAWWPRPVRLLETGTIDLK